MRELVQECETKLKAPFKADSVLVLRPARLPNAGCANMSIELVDGSGHTVISVHVKGGKEVSFDSKGGDCGGAGPTQESLSPGNMEALFSCRGDHTVSVYNLPHEYVVQFDFTVSHHYKKRHKTDAVAVKFSVDEALRPAVWDCYRTLQDLEAAFQISEVEHSRLRYPRIGWEDLVKVMVKSDHGPAEARAVQAELDIWREDFNRFKDNSPSGVKFQGHVAKADAPIKITTFDNCLIVLNFPHVEHAPDKKCQSHTFDFGGCKLEFSPSTGEVKAEKETHPINGLFQGTASTHCAAILFEGGKCYILFDFMKRMTLPVDAKHCNGGLKVTLPPPEAWSMFRSVVVETFEFSKCK